jgi:hypothetical protein
MEELALLVQVVPFIVVLAQPVFRVSIVPTPFVQTILVFARMGELVHSMQLVLFIVVHVLLVSRVPTVPIPYAL